MSVAGSALLLALTLVAQTAVAQPGRRAASRKVLPASVTVERTPRLSGVADATLWRSLRTTDVVFGGKKRPIWVRATTQRAKALLREMGVNVGPSGLALASLDNANWLRVLNAGEGFELTRAPAHRPLLDKSILDIGADLVFSGNGVELSRTGKGVLVGVIDTGIDLGHPAFRDAQGRSRIIAAWDQDGDTGRSPEGFGYGTECRAADLRANDCGFADATGHGTHVAGIAAGSGHVKGVAYEADIAVVRSDTFTQLADAVEYLVRLADKRDQPLVINVSVGGQYGPHDGQTPLEEYLKDRLGPGRILVAAAGNDAQARAHVGFELTREPLLVAVESIPFGKRTETLIELWTRPETQVELWLELWYDGAPILTEKLVANDSEMLDGVLASEGQALGAFGYGVDFLGEHGLARRSVMLDFSKYEGLPSSVTLALALSGRGRIDGWISQTDYRFGHSRFGLSRGEGWVAGDGAMSLTVPATASKVIAVGAYTTRSAWTSESGQQTSLGEPLGSLALYSSIGPTLLPMVTGMKPDIAAPGSVIVSARAISVPNSVNTLDGERVAMQGTSMASPHVAGVVGLMLEANPQLGPVRARHILQNTARADQQTGEVPNHAWGYGKLDALAAVQLSEKEVDSCSASPGTLAMALASLVLMRRKRSRRVT